MLNYEKRSFWLSVDPLADLTVSPYAYVWNDPVNYADPTESYEDFSKDYPEHNLKGMPAKELAKLSWKSTKEVAKEAWTNPESQAVLLMPVFAVGEILVAGEFASSANTARQIAFGGRVRASKFGSEWAEVSLSDVISTFAPKAEGITTSTGKTIYKNSETGMQVVVDNSGGYFRIENTNISGKRVYTDLTGNIPSNKIINVKTVGRSQSEYNKATHYKIKK